MKFWGREKAAVMRRKRLSLKRRQVAAFVRSAEFCEHLLKPRPAKAPGKAENQKEARAKYVALAILEDDLLRTLGAKSRVLRLTDRVADKMWRKHGPGMRYRRSTERREKNVPPEWYADIPKILREVKPYKNHYGRWQFDHAGLKRRLVLDLDERKNPVMITYYGEKNLK